MGFSSALLGRVAHEALVVRQDAELRLMETMKRSMQLKAKCDREYAISLAAVAQQGLKIDRADELQGSLITKSWRSYMDELDVQAKQLKTNAEQLEVVCDKLTHLSQDKRKARKTYQEEHAKIAARLNHLTDEVLRKKAEYQKHLEGYKALRTRFEEHYIKSGRGGRKLDDVRDKYQKACRKLHLTHNEYVLSITEAVEVEKDFRSVLLPGLLEHQQSVQESFVLLWKNILQEASQHGDLTSDKFREIQKRIDSVINNINPSEEYREFTEKHKQSSPITPLIFQFDESLIEDIPGKLQSNTLTVDNLTVDWLRSRLIDLEQSVKECQEKQIKMIEHVNGGSPIANGTPLSNGNGHGHTNSILSNKDYQSRQSKDLSALRCQEKQKQKLVDMIKCALNEVGCEELPSGCDDHLALEQNFIENGFNNDQQGSSNGVSIFNELRRRGGVLTLWRGRHFKRKSTPQPTTPTVSRLHPQRLDTLKPRSQSLGSLSVNSSPARYEPITNYPLRMAASVEVATGPGRRRQLNAVELLDVELMAFGTAALAPNGGGTLALRRFQRSMLCVAEEATPAAVVAVVANGQPAAVANDQPAVVAVATNASDCSNPLNPLPNNNNNNNKNNNNNIYTDLVLGEQGDESESIKSGELAMRKVRNVEIEINWKETQANATKTESADEQASLDEASGSPPAQPPPLPLPNATCAKLQQEEATTKNSIDAHLDKIDELNRALDDRLKRNITQQTIMDLDAIEAVDSVTVVTRPRSEARKAEDKNGSKRTSSSSSDCHAYLSRKTHDSDEPAAEGSNKGSKKRSMSFSQKSINALICNLKEFSRSPLARMHKHHGGGTAAPVTATSYTQTLPEDEEDFSSADNNHQTEEVVATAKMADAVASVSSKKHSKDAAKPDKVKFKMPKIQKKSKGIRQTFRTKLMNFQMKRNNNQKLCKTCTKRRRIHPSKSVFDFAKEFNLSAATAAEQPISLPPATGDGDDSDDECVEFCTCPREADSQPARLTVANSDYQKRTSSSSMDAEDEGDSSDDAAGGGGVAKEPCYCIPSLATSVSTLQSSAERLR